MRKTMSMKGSIAAAALACIGCVTVNLYFPVAELRSAAEEIVGDARPGEVSAVPAPSGGVEGGERAVEEPVPAEDLKSARRQAPRGPAAALLALFGPRVAHAASAEDKDEDKDKDSAKKVEIDITSPVIKRIREALKKRYPRLLPFYLKGAIGEGRDGYMALREVGGLGLKEKKDVQTLLAEENADRKNLYTEIARANEIDASRVPDIGLLFSEEWQKKSKTGWWIEKEKGKWIRKPAEKKEKKDKEKKKEA